MQIVDSQMHEIGPRLAWENADNTTRHDVLTEIMLGWMDAVGVDAAIINPGDAPWLMTAMAQFPERLAGVFHVRNLDQSDVEQRVAQLMTTPGALGHRHTFGRQPIDPNGSNGREKFKADAFNSLFAACQKYDRPLFCSAYGATDLVGEAARTYPRLRLVVDHMGIAQPPLNPHVPEPWRALDDLLPLAALPNVYVKLCGAPVLSDQSFPYTDVWPHIHRILRAFDVTRVMWASDIGRFQGRIGWSNEFEVAHGTYRGKHNYAEALRFMLDTDQISESEKEQLLGGTVRRFTGWKPRARPKEF